MTTEPAYLSRVTTLVRARHGNCYHRRGCPRARNQIPWIWAEGRSREEIAESHANGLHPCRVCKPLEDRRADS